MPRIAYVNGQFLPLPHACVHIEDRGFQFADGVYEVIAVRHRQLVDEAPHLDRLERSLREIRLEAPVSRRGLEVLLRRLVDRNRLRDGLVYLQVTRGVARRDFMFPVNARPSLVMTARPASLNPAGLFEHGVKVVTIPDIRWKRRDIKSIALLPQVLGKQRAADAGAFEAWQLDDDGYVTEGCSSNAWIVTREGELITRELSPMILSGVTRRSMLQLADRERVSVQERAFTLEEALRAREAFLTSATSFILPIVQIDDRLVGDGRPGTITRRLRELYWQHAGRGADEA